MSLRKMTRQVQVKLSESGAQRVLVTSAMPGDGKSVFVKELVSGLRRSGYAKKIEVIAASQLKRRDPQKTAPVVLVDGPAFFDDEGFDTIPEAWMERFDAAAVLLLGRSSRRKDVVELFDWLRQYRIREIWPIWNEKLSPPAVSLPDRVRFALGLDKGRATRAEHKPASKGEVQRDGPRPESGSGLGRSPVQTALGMEATGRGATAGLVHSTHDEKRYEPAFVAEKAGTVLDKRTKNTDEPEDN